MAPTEGSREATGTPVIDAHQHFWRAGQHATSPWAHEVFGQEFTPAQLSPTLDGLGVDGTILVQATNGTSENDALVGWVKEAPFVRGVVYWLPLEDAAEARRLLPSIAALPAARGARRLVGDDPLTWALTPAAERMWWELAAAGLCWEIVAVTREQTAAVRTVAEAVPDLRVVVDHMARPPIESDGWQPWAHDVESLASLPNVAVKASVGVNVLERWEEWSRDRLRRYLDWIVTSFGPRRVMLASNWPVVLMRRGYTEAWRDLLGAMGELHLDQDATAAVTGGTAVAWYGVA